MEEGLLVQYARACITNTYLIIQVLSHCFPLLQFVYTSIFHLFLKQLSR